MRKIFYTLGLVGLIGFAVGCSTDFELNGEFEETAILYGLLNHQDSDHYIRLQKAYLGTTSAVDLAQDPDNLYFENAKVEIWEYTSNSLNTKTDEFTLTELPADEAGVEKEEGIFSTDSYQLFHTDEELRADRFYRVVVETDEENTVTAGTGLVQDFEVITPRENVNFNLVKDNTAIRWVPAVNGSIYDLQMIFKYKEEKNNDPSDFFRRTLVYQAFANLDGAEAQSGSAIEFMFQPDNLFQFIKREIEEDATEDLVVRRFEGLEIRFVAGGEELESYFENALATGNGLAGGQITPSFTNVDNGLGLLSSRFEKQYSVNLAPASIEKLVCGEITGHLSFEDTQADCN